MDWRRLLDTVIGATMIGAGVVLGGAVAAAVLLGLAELFALVAEVR